MAVGFTPKHIEDFSPDGINPEQFLVIALETANKLDWKIGSISDRGFIAHTNNGMLSWNAEIKITIENGSAILKSSSIGGEMMDWGKNKKNIKEFISTFEELKSSFTDEELAFKYQELKTQFVSPEVDALKIQTDTTTEQGNGFFSIFKPTKGYFITPILIDLNILIFLVMIIAGVDFISPDNESLILWGANFRPITLDGEWWRVVTSCFLHIGVIHLLMNMYALLYIGVLLEPILGKLRFASAYLLTGIGASLTSLWWHDLTVSAGASGAIFGMYGVFLALLTTNLIDKGARKTLLSSIGVFVAFNLLNGLKDGIDNAAHIGGLIGGLMIGYWYVPSLKKDDQPKIKYLTVGMTILFALVSSYLVYSNIPNDIVTYDSKMKEFASTETSALEVFNMPENTPNDTLLSCIKDKGIRGWKKNIELIDAVGKLNLPVEINEKNSKLRKYCELRLKSYELMYKGVSENTNSYNEQIEEYNKQIEGVINELKNGQQEE